MECEFPKENASNEEIAHILRNAKVIAVIGASLKPERPSHWISVYLKEQGYKVIPVNPGVSEILGDKCYKSLSEIREPIDIVDIFRYLRRPRHRRRSHRQKSQSDLDAGRHCPQ